MLSPRGFLLFGKHHHHPKQPQQEQPSPPQPQQQPPTDQDRRRRQQPPSLASPLAGSRAWDSSTASQKNEAGGTDRDYSSSGSTSNTTATIQAGITARDAMTARSRLRLGDRAGAVVVSTPATAPAGQLTSPSSSPPPTTSSPVCIPASRQQREDKKKRHIRQTNGRADSQPVTRCDTHNPDAIPPSVAALLAVTSIPRSRSQRSLGLAGGSVRQRPQRDDSMTVDAIMRRAQKAEKEISLSLAGDPMGLLLGSSEKGLDSDLSIPLTPDFDDDTSSVAGSTHSTNLSGHTVSAESFLSLEDSFTSPRTPGTPLSPFSSPSPSGPSRRRSSHGPRRRRLEPVSSPPGSTAIEDHPLATKRAAAPPPVDELDFRVFGTSPSSTGDWKGFDMALPLQPLKSAFKSNLTASLRALRNAARSISTLGQASIPPEDFLTRSILTIDPRVPFTDERRPPQLDEEPSAALRRYLNPTTGARMESRPASAPAPVRSPFTASIQMQTYKVRRSRAGASPVPPSGIPHPSPQLGQTSEPGPPGVAPGPDAVSGTTEGESSVPGSPGPPAPLAIPGRQREMRENSDFIRIAVMEMAMRKRGKLDDQRPGRARWALPARRTSTTPYQIGPDGVPTRWVAIAAM